MTASHDSRLLHKIALGYHLALHPSVYIWSDCRAEECVAIRREWLEAAKKERTDEPMPTMRARVDPTTEPFPDGLPTLQIGMVGRPAKTR